MQRVVIARGTAPSAALVLLLCAACSAMQATLVTPSAAVPTGQLASPTAPPVPLAITPSDAIESVVAFVNAPDLTGDLTVRGPTDGAFARAYEVLGRKVIASVNASDGTVMTLVYSGITTPGAPTTDADGAAEAAQGYLDQHGVPSEGLERTVRWQDHGESSEFVVEWLGLEGGVRVPNMREVGVDAASGRVFRYVYVNHPYSAPPEPLVDRTAAEEVAIRAANGSPEAKIDGSELVVTFTPDGVQHLVWQVRVTDGIAHAWVEVDSQTGAATVTARG